MKKTLFKHINSYVYFSVKEKLDAFPNSVLAKPLNQLIDKVTSTIDVEYKGYEIGCKLLENFNKDGVLSAKQISLEDEGYKAFLENHLHSWGVPLSYNDYYNLIGNENYLPAFNRTLNLLGCAKSHDRYFADLIELLHHPIVTNLPKGILDVGCGDGALLKLIANSAIGKLGNFIYVGVDISEDAIAMAKRECPKDNFHFIKGEVGNPVAINQALLESGLPALNDFFIVRAFVDHNMCLTDAEIYNQKEKEDAYYLHNYKPVVSKALVKEKYKDLFEDWKPFIEIHGAGIIDLHSLSQIDINTSLSFAYEVFHLLSNQYLLDYEEIEKLRLESGWETIGLKIYPKDGGATVSVGVFR